MSLLARPEEKKFTGTPLETKIRDTIQQTMKSMVEAPKSVIVGELKEDQQRTLNELLLKEHQVIVYSNRIYITKHTGNKLIWIKDYYMYKSGRTDDYNTSFYLDINKRHFISFNDTADDAYKTQLFYGFLNVVKIINDTSDENIGKIHLELLKSRLFNKVIPSISKDEIISREEHHRAKILKDINSYIEKISSHLYKMTEDGIQILRICFDEISEISITDLGKIPHFKDYPCSDGKIRHNFTEYSYFLLEKVYKREVDEISDQDWIGAKLVEKCKNIYPHLHFSYESSKSLLPKIVLNLNIDTSQVWM
jgi:hypothetical protein